MRLVYEMPYLLRIELEDTSPKIWRKFTLPERTPLDSLHLVINCLFGWQMSTAILFCINQSIYRVRENGTGNSYYDRDLGLDYRNYSLKSRMIRAGDIIEFQLFNIPPEKPWRHKIQVIKDFTQEGAENLTAPICMDGGNNSPPSSCEGPEAYQKYISDRGGFASSTESGKESFDPEFFDLKKMNTQLKRLKLRVFD